MKCIIVQVHTQKDGSFTLDECLKHIRAAGRHPEVEPEEDDPAIVNLNFFTEDAPAFWQEFQRNNLQDTPTGRWLKNVAIIVCEGQYGWNDALLLAHFDASETLDALTSST